MPMQVGLTQDNQDETGDDKDLISILQDACPDVVSSVVDCYFDTETEETCAQCFWTGFLAEGTPGCDDIDAKYDESLAACAEECNEECAGVEANLKNCAVSATCGSVAQVVPMKLGLTQDNQDETGDDKDLISILQDACPDVVSSVVDCYFDTETEETCAQCFWTGFLAEGTPGCDDIDAKYDESLAACAEECNEECAGVEANLKNCAVSATCGSVAQIA